MTLGEFARTVNASIQVDMELRDSGNCHICLCSDDSKVIGMYGKCEVIDWWSVKDSGRVIVHIDDSEVV